MGEAGGEAVMSTSMVCLEEDATGCDVETGGRLDVDEDEEATGWEGSLDVEAMGEVRSVDGGREGVVVVVPEGERRAVVRVLARLRFVGAGPVVESRDVSPSNVEADADTAEVLAERTEEEEGAAGVEEEGRVFAEPLVAVEPGALFRFWGTFELDASLSLSLSFPSRAFSFSFTGPFAFSPAFSFPASRSRRIAALGPATANVPMTGAAPGRDGLDVEPELVDEDGRWMGWAVSFC